MITYMEKQSEIREKIDIMINEREELDLASPELVEKALMLEKELLALH